MNNKYHIDVTPEEDLLFQDKKNQKTQASKNTMFGGVFWTVVGVHAVALGALATTSFAKSSTKNEPSESATQTNNVTPPTQTTSPTTERAAIAPKAPTPVEQPTASSKQPSAKTNLTVPGLTKTYTVKRGDTINNIAKRFKLNTDRLLKLNNIKDSNKIVVGQTLKFL